MSKEALPPRYTVDRKGVSDPEAAEYYVLDVVHDRHARVALARLASLYRQYGQETAAEEAFDLLNRTSAAHQKVVEDLYEAKNRQASATGRGRRK